MWQKRLFSFSSLVLLCVIATSTSGCSPTPERRETAPAANHSPAVQTRSNYVFTTDEGANALSRIDLTTGEVRAFPLPIRPHNVQASTDGSRVIVAGPVVNAADAHQEHGSMSGMPGRLLVLDAQSMDVAAAVAVDIGSSPAHVVVNGDTTRAYVTDSGSNTVQVVDLAQRKVLSEVATGRYPHGLRISPDGSTIAVANLEDNSISLIDVAASKESARVPVGKAPVQVSWAPDGNTVYVTLRDEDAVAVVDATTRQKKSSVPVGDGPIQLFVTPDGRFVYVANEGTEETPATTVSVIDTSTMQVVRTIAAGKGPHGVVISPAGNRIYVTNRFDDSVLEIDGATQKVVRTHKVGDEPTGITYAGPE
jgi:YVTN family beta-propeller protein